MSKSNQLIKDKRFDQLTRVERLEFNKKIKPILEAVDNLYEVMQVHCFDIWKLLRECGRYGWASWTDEELRNYNRETGLIGKKDGVFCYMVF